MQVVEGHARSGREPREGLEVVADARGWSRWGAWRESEVEREGEPPPAGLGGLFRRGLQRFIEDAAERLAREAERS